MRTLALLLTLTAGLAAQEWTPLFNGTDLKGWSGSKKHWSVENGCIVGTTDVNPLQVNTFLVYEKPFANFHLSAEMKLRDGNSGIQFRSTLLPGPGWIVYGTQADASDKDESWGNYYEERGRSRSIMKTRDEGWLKAQEVLKKGGWNRVEVIAKGPAVRLLLNGKVTWEGTDDKKLDGIIALQLHFGDPMRVEFRDIKIKVLP